jgi:predicted XRE-type DNA-binding protein
MTVTPSCGNVFADLGLENPEELLQKSKLVVAIQDAMVDRGLNQSRAAKLMNVNQPDLSKLLRGRTTSFTLDRLFGMLNALGSDVEITVVRHSGRDAERGTTSIREAVLH